MKSFFENPITGRGILYNIKYDVGKDGSFGYGFIGMFAMYGLFFGLFYMWFFFRGFQKMNLFFHTSLFYLITAFIIINLGLLTQASFLQTPFIFFFIIGLFAPISSIGTMRKNNRYSTIVHA